MGKEPYGSVLRLRQKFANRQSLLQILLARIGQMGRMPYHWELQQWRLQDAVEEQKRIVELQKAQAVRAQQLYMTAQNVNVCMGLEFNPDEKPNEPALPKCKPPIDGASFYKGESTE